MEDTETFMMEQRTFSNGDVYIGNFNKALPQGKGRYIWADGTVYLGDWEEGKMTGKGQIIWPSGAKFEGDISSSYINGFGEFENTGGSIYKGTWRMNINHGVGKKHYANLDVYEGAWKEGERDGCGHYVWSSGNSYVGNWKGGKMFGKGVMKYVNGDVFSGFWLEGFKHGCGIYKFGDGSYYLGTWNRGLKDGKGTFYPSGTQPLVFGKWSSLLGINDNELFSSSSISHNFEQSKVSRLKVNRSGLLDKIFLWRILRTSGRISDRDPIGEKLGFSDNASKEIMCTCKNSSCTLFHAWDDGRDAVGDKSSFVYEKEYMQGVLMKERIRNYAEMVRKYKLQNKPSLKSSTKKSSVDIDESHRSYYLMLNLQLGIRYTVGKITPVPMREVRSSDFGEGARIRMYFPRRGSQYTPPHLSVDFHWKDYCPMVFRNLREMFKLDAAEYMMSICGDDGLRELSSPGKSGSIFYLSQDDRFVIKTLKKPELKVLLRMLPSYYVHVRNHENTLITKIFGLHRIKLKGGKKVRFVVMGNMFCTELHIHRCYDLKGSTHGRFTSQDKVAEGTSTTLKDLDLSYEFHMDKSLRESLLKQISLDCSFLKSQKIIDYSLLLGLHFRAPQHLKTFLEPVDTTPDQNNSFAQEGSSSERGERGSANGNGLILVTHEPSFGSNSMAHGPHIRGSVLKAYSLGDQEVDLLLPGTARLQVQLGVNMPAKATSKGAGDGDESVEVELFEVYEVVLYMGIIDILQDYNLRKKLEHAYKSVRYDPVSVSVVEPELYANRFIDFLENIFTC